MVWQCFTESHEGLFQGNFANNNTCGWRDLWRSRRKLTAPSLAATCNSLSPRKSMRWFSGSNVMIVGPILLTSKKLKFSSWKNGVWPIGYFPIAISLLVAFGHYRYNKTNECILYLWKLQQVILIWFCKFSCKSEIIIGLLRLPTCTVLPITRRLRIK